MKLSLSLLLCLCLSSVCVMSQSNKWNTNKVIAHRGAWKKNNLPENSIASLKEAFRLKCYGSEFDVHMTADGMLVVNHDDDFQGIVIAKSTFKQLQEKKMSNGEEIPTLEQYLKEGKKQKGTRLILEIKEDKNQQHLMDLTNAVVAMVKKMKMEEWMEYISFNYGVLQRILELDPKAKVAYLKGEVSPEQLKADRFAGADYHFSVFKKDESWFSKAKELGLTLNAWTVNQEADMKWLLDRNVDFITTNEPELLFEVVKGK
ncbi:glycerophosphoryl diester phosphodiesterase [Pedobacter nutrimenti]|uniref:Glycerophosphoryl diester phosphodiesterase n=2 Tax=Pedobacter nutrimenti TaxID=1241337 RepID=A0A318UH60_9SPHI|nr:glycerophosphoryl diester phosphodiesterase [Pedobacter nutrimenti]